MSWPTRCVPGAGHGAGALHLLGRRAWPFAVAPVGARESCAFVSAIRAPRGVGPVMGHWVLGKSLASGWPDRSTVLCDCVGAMVFARSRAVPKCKPMS